MDGLIRNYKEYRNNGQRSLEADFDENLNCIIRFRENQYSWPGIEPADFEKNITPCIITPFDSVANKEQILGSNDIWQIKGKS